MLLPARQPAFTFTNTDTKTFDVYEGTSWSSLGYENNNVKIIRKLADFPTPVNGEITLDATKTYTVSGTVNIGTNYINLNGAVIRGINPLTDVIVSAANGAVLRSAENYVFIEKL